MKMDSKLIFFSNSLKKFKKHRNRQFFFSTSIIYIDQEVSCISIFVRKMNLIDLFRISTNQ